MTQLETGPVEIHGMCDPRFQPVRDMFASNFATGQELGASVAVTLHGEPVVDLWAGSADTAGRAWESDTIVNVWSTTKTMAAICMLMLADRGEIDIDAPVATYWPEFAANGKDNVRVAHVLGHTAGMSGWDPAIEPEVLYDWDKACSVLAAQATWWEPGAFSAYHAITQGFLEGEIVRRVTGRTIGTFFREEVAGPLGADFHIGLPESEEARVGEIVPPTVGIEGPDVDPESLGGQDDRGAADDGLPDQHDHREPGRHRAVDQDPAGADEEQQPIGDGVEDLAQVRGLVEVAGQVAVDPIGDAQGREQPRCRLPVLVGEQQPEEQRQAGQPDQGDEVGQGEDAIGSFSP